MRQYLLISHNGSNVGDAAIAASTIQHIRSQYPDAHITLESSHPEISRRYFKDVDIVDRYFSVKNLQVSDAGSTIGMVMQNTKLAIFTGFRIGWLLLVTRLGIKYFMPSILKLASQSDMVLSIAGDSISYRYAYYLRFLEINAITKVNPNIVLYAQSIGPFKSAISRRWAAKSLSNAKVILARDEKTKSLLKEYGVTAEIRRTADSAISLEPLATEQTTKVLEGFSGFKVVGIVVRTAILSDMTTVEYKNYLSRLASLINQIEKDPEFMVVFVSSIGEDAKAARNFEASYLSGERLMIDLGDYGPRGAKTVLSGLHYLVSPRMHPVILASSMGVSVYGLTKEFKLVSYLNDLGLEKSYAPIDSFDPNLVANIILNLSSDAQAVYRIRNEKLAALRELSLSNGLSL